MKKHILYTYLRYVDHCGICGDEEYFLVSSVKIFGKWRQLSCKRIKDESRLVEGNDLHGLEIIKKMEDLSLEEMIKKRHRCL